MRPDSGRLSVDAARCEGHGMCEQLAPDLVHLDDDGELIVDVPDVAPSEMAQAHAAVRACPVAALSLDEKAQTPARTGGLPNR